jgi:ribosomal protein S18 acetylase RimI-like enzyme
MEQKIVIREIDKSDLNRITAIDDSFIVDSVLVPSIVDGKIVYAVNEVPQYSKRYSEGQAENADLSAYTVSPDRIAYIAFAGERAVGRLLLRKNWNRYAYVEDLAVDVSCRVRGVGRMLMNRARHWAETGGMPGIMLETQNNNVGACRFYERCGFIIGGFDTHLYRGITEHKHEVALFWYLDFAEEASAILHAADDIP